MELTGVIGINSLRSWSSFACDAFEESYRFSAFELDEKELTDECIRQ